MLHVRTLGELRQWSDGESRSLRRKPLALLSYLARRAPHAVTRVELATLFWGERGEERARQSLRQALLELKQRLGDRIEIDADSVRLEDGAVELDIVAFERELSAGRVQEAAQRWTGEFFDGAEDIGGEGFLRWIENERLALHQHLGAAMASLMGEAQLRGDWTAAAAWAERWAAALPFDEEPHRRLIEALRMAGRSRDALTTHAAFVTRIRTARDGDPSDEFLRLGDGLAEDARDELARRGRGSAAVHAPALVGRGPVMSELADAWKKAAEGTPVVVLLEGAAGSGLTRICDEMVARVGANGVVLSGRGTASADYATAAALFDGLRNAEGSAGAAPEALAEVARLVPALATQFRHLPAPVGEEGALRDALVQTLAAISEEQPVLLILDDAHAADEASRRLLSSVASRLTGSVMLLLAADEGKRDPGPAASVLLGTRGLRFLRLAELTTADVEAMLGSMVALEPRDRHAVAVRLREESGGLPYDIRELVATLVDHNLLTLDSGGTWGVAPTLPDRPLPLPAPVRERVRARLEGLSPPAQSLASALAVVGVPTATAFAGTIAALSPDETEGAVRELATRRMSREAARPEQIELATPLLGHAIASLLPATKRDALQARAAELHAARVVSAPASNMPASPASGAGVGAARSTPTASKLGRLAIPALAIAVVMVLALRRDLPFRSTRVESAVPVVALGHIADYRENVTTDLTKPLTDMLATNLGRVGRLRVVSTARIYELVSQANHGGDTSAAALVTAARRAGATELVDGALYARADGGLRLDLRRVELASGNIQKTHSVSGATLFELADSGTARLANDFGETTPVGSVADVTTRSVTAYRFYEQGLRAYFANDLRGAEPLFEAALREDSTFAMAAYYSAKSVVDNPHVAMARYRVAERLAAHASDRERLTILAHVAFMASSPTLHALAETLVVRYPDEVEGYYYTGLRLMQDGEFLRALAPLNRVVTMDTLALEGTRASCAACEALRQIVSSYSLADSLRAAERETRRWIRLQPRSPFAWYTLGDVLAQSGRFAEVPAVLDSAAAFDDGRREGDRLRFLAVHRVHAGDYEQGDRLLAGELESGSPYREFIALWYRTISYRQQGRFKEALADARRYRTLAMAKYPRGIVSRRKAAPPEALAEAQVLYELGRFRESAALFDSVSRWSVGDELPSHLAHARVWAMTHAAGARVAAGDTTGLAARIDTLEALGPLSALGRDRLLHYYVRGLLLAARGDDEGSITELKRAVWSWNFGYTRTNVALASALLRQGRARQAVLALQPALRGPMEASNYYVTRTEIHDLLGQAWRAVGDADPVSRDSAAAHFAIVARAWSRADSSLAPRVRQAQAGK